MLPVHTRFIKYPSAFVRERREEAPAPMFRHWFSVRGDILRASLSFAALGVGKLFLNGMPVSHAVLTTPFGDYRKTVWYDTADVTALLHAGQNLAAAMLGNGFYNESIKTSWDFNTADWRDSPKLMFSLELVYPDGTEYVTGSENWLTDIDRSPVRWNELRAGERYDANFDTDWMTPDYDDSGWVHAVIADSPTGIPRENPAPPIIEDTVYNPAAITKAGNGKFVFDFGQNMSGYPHITMSLPAGTHLHLICAEEVDKNGDRVDNTLAGHYKDGETQFFDVTFGEKPLDWKPCFSYSGFRYLIVSGFPEGYTPSDTDICAVFVHQGVRQTGHFSCSDKTLDTIWRYARLSTLSNLFNMPTDCPTREKLGWCNDAQASCEQMTQNYDMTGLWKKWLQDIFDAMKPDGDLPGIVPTPAWGYAWGSGPVSTGILFEIPYRLFQYTGSDEALRAAYPYMCRHLDFLRAKENNGLIEHGLTDWALPYDEKTPVPVPLGFTCTLLMIKFLRVAAMTAERMGFDPSAHREAEKYYIDSFRRHFMLSDGTLTITEQTSSAMTIALGVGDTEKLKPQFLKALHKYDGHFHVGMLGMQYIFRACDICGFEEEAYRLLTAEGYPSYRHWFDGGATVLHEMWADRESKNHHMYSYPVTWFRETILGIRQDETLFTESRFRIEPCFLEKIDHAEGEYDTPAGKIAVSWRRGYGAEIRLSVTVPDRITAELSARGTEKTLSAGHWELTF